MNSTVAENTGSEDDNKTERKKLVTMDSCIRFLKKVKNDIE